MRKLSIALITALSLAAFPAHADRGYGHHGRGGGGGAAWAGLAVFGALAGMAIMAERSRPVYAAPYYAEPVYAEPVYAAPPTYTAPPAYAAPAPVAPETWYYCQSSAMYYPYTGVCPEGWQAVPATPY